MKIKILSFALAFFMIAGTSATSYAQLTASDVNITVVDDDKDKNKKTAKKECKDADVKSSCKTKKSCCKSSMLNDKCKDKKEKSDDKDKR